MAVPNRSELLASICPGDRSIARQQDLDSARLDGVGQWFIDNPYIRAWLTGSSPQLFWLEGFIATGKTFLSSRIVNHIKTDSSMKASNAAVGVYYFEKTKTFWSRADFDRAVSSVARQLVSQLPDTSAFLQSPQSIQPSTPGAGPYPMLRRIMSEFNKVFIVLDGVKDASSLSLSGLMDALNEQKADGCTVRVLITSRDSPTNVLGRPLLSMRAYATLNDLEAHATASMQDAFAKLRPQGRSMVKVLIREGFSYYVASFAPLPPTKLYDRKSGALKALAQFIQTNPNVNNAAKIRDFCSTMMAQIKSHKSGDMVCCVLYHLVKIGQTDYSFTLPMADEALDAWGIYHEDGTRYATSEIAEICAGLVFLSNDGQTMRIRSPWLEKFLGGRDFETEWAEWEERFVTASMRYLSKDAFATGACKSSAELKNRFKNHRYLWYAARMLSGSLFKSAPELFIPAFLRLSSRNGSIDSYFQAAAAWPYHDDNTYDELEAWEERWGCFTDGYHPLHLAAHLGAPASLINALVERGDDLEALTPNDQTPLHLAAGISDDVSTLRALLASGSKVSAKDMHLETPLSIALVHGSVRSVELLFEYGAKFKAIDRDTLQDVLEECVEEKPAIACYLKKRGIRMPKPRYLAFT
ncbi:hypothetical protein NM208_g7186 [Fusarium decemcellulare]|uniref:Uncharacterized protein n=1 Tax=Fusarium decemcellulare TaxID=57161 RepID=A0ACC1SA71_9HYPO|nr:hypothetical protein NM208_g7186 [Fusarium decemcellulare]